MSEYLDSADLAARLGIKVKSVHRMRTRGNLPKPDRMVGRSPTWKPATIDAWQANRPGHGWRKATADEDQAVDVAAEPVDEPLLLPPGDIRFDGRILSVDGVPLTAGRYLIGETGAVLEVAPDTENDSAE